jgi:hypothetical protein
MELAKMLMKHLQLVCNMTGFQFTKTQHKPYDNHVLACLILSKIYYGDKIRVSSDGDEW